MQQDSIWTNYYSSSSSSFREYAEFVREHSHRSQLCWTDEEIYRREYQNQDFHLDAYYSKVEREEFSFKKTFAKLQYDIEKSIYENNSNLLHTRLIIDEIIEKYNNDFSGNSINEDKLLYFLGCCKKKEKHGKNYKFYLSDISFDTYGHIEIRISGYFKNKEYGISLLISREMLESNR